MDVQFRFTARSDVGLVRKNNQDSGYAGPHLLVLADGMGGPAGGDIASSIAIAHLAPLDDDAVAPDQLLSRLRLALQDAHDDLLEHSEADRQLRGLGTTCIALLRSGNKMAMVHIGDSRAYLLREGTLTQVTTDHSFVQYLVDTGQITPEEAQTHPKRSVILRVLGDAPGQVVADETMREAIVGDRWLLCSDGLSGVVSAETITSVMTEIDDLDQCAEHLVELALRAGAPDNVTVVMADVVPPTDAVPTAPEVVGAAAVDRLAPTRGSQGAAGRAAALIQGQDASTGYEEHEEPPRSRWRWWIYALAAFLVLVVGLGGWATWTWSQSQYYVIGTAGKVVIYQGIPQKIGSLEFSHPLEVTDVSLDQLPDADRQRLNDPVTRTSLQQAQGYVQQLRARVNQRMLDQPGISGGISEGSADYQQSGSQMPRGGG